MVLVYGNQSFKSQKLPVKKDDNKNGSVRFDERIEIETQLVRKKPSLNSSEIRYEPEMAYLQMFYNGSVIGNEKLNLNMLINSE